MTDEMMNLRALLEESPDADLLRGIFGFPAAISRDAHDLVDEGHLRTRPRRQRLVRIVRG